MTIPQDLADRLRLEMAIEALIAASLQILHHDGRDGDDVDVYERAQLRKAFTPILASLRRSASASGEMREAVVHAVYVTFEQLGKRKPLGQTVDEIVESALIRLNTLRTPSGETGEDAGS